MKTILNLRLFVFLCISSTVFAQKNVSSFTSTLQARSEDISLKTENTIVKDLPVTAIDDWQSSAIKYIAESQYFINKVDNQYVLANEKQKISSIINPTKIVTQPIEFEGNKNRRWQSSLELKKIFKNTNSIFKFGTPEIVTKNNHLEYKYGDFEIEYLNNEQGLRQNFIVNKKPEGNENLQVLLLIDGDLKPSVFNKTSLILSDKITNKTLLKYDGLKVWDANYKHLEASMKLKNTNELILIIDDKNAVYPITIDPLTHTPEWTNSAASVLPGLLNTSQLQTDAIHGYNVAGLGDINNDGFDDVAIGAPGTIDITAGPTTIVAAGAVFVYYGSVNGLPITPSIVLRSTTPVANSFFGLSIASGNVIGNPKKDIIIGAPGESYSASVSGTPSTATVSAGKVYVFDGQNLTDGATTPINTIYLDGSVFFSNGILGVLLSNVSINALFGFSVAATEDMNSDGLGEIIVGAPGYAGVQLLDVRTGAAFVYYSGDIITNTPTQLSAPSLLGFPDLINLNGLLFGFSVDGAGDYDKDGKPDVVVGAPGGLNLGVQGLLGGSAYVYKGTGTGVSTTIATRLTSAGPLLGSAANLFGYSVKGVRGIDGVRNGNIIVGAPSGNVLSNILGGLQLKAGSINIFTAKSSPLATETPIQSISSPREASLLSILNGLNLNVQALFGSSIDNMMDVNRDGITDIIVGEPLSTGVGIINGNLVGGTAYVFLGDGTDKYHATPYWQVENSNAPQGINAASLLGYSVAGGGHVRGPLKSVRALVGNPGKALDFSTGILNLGNTLGTTLNFLNGNDGIGQAYAFAFNSDVLANPDINVAHINVLVAGNVNTNDVVPVGTTYNTPTPDAGNPVGATINMNSDGTYTFIATTPGVYVYSVPVCITGQPCIPSLLTVTILSPMALQQPPVVNTDIVSVNANSSVVINSLANDHAANIHGSLNPASVTVTGLPLHGTTSINPATGEITYTPAANYDGMDTITYSVCDNSLPTPLCGTAKQVIYVKAVGAANTTVAADDYINSIPNTPVSGNVKANDNDPESNTQTVTAQNTVIPGKGTFVLGTDGAYSFTPQAGFTGSVSFIYNICDDGIPQACAKGTLYVLVTPAVTLNVKVLLQGNTTVNAGVGTMTTTLNSLGLLPTAQPYNMLPAGSLTIGYTGAEAVAADFFANHPTIVDWVLIELRDKNNPANILATRAVLLKNDGIIVDIDGVSLVTFPGLVADNYYVAVRHRNHFGIRSTNTVALTEVPATYDFTTAASRANGANAMYNNSGVFCMWMGNVNGDNKIAYSAGPSDVSIVIAAVVNAPGNTLHLSNYSNYKAYSTYDVNLDGFTKYSAGPSDVSLIIGNVTNYPGNTLHVTNYNLFLERLP